jgi:hypothetical protein
MPWQMNYKGVIKKERNEECSNQNISLILLQMKMLQQVEKRSPAKRPSRLSSDVRVETLYYFAATLKLVLW